MVRQGFFKPSDEVLNSHIVGAAARFAYQVRLRTSLIRTSGFRDAALAL